MSLTPFSKSNSIAMLNTLYPPVTNVQPTAQLTPHVLTCQRNGFFKYITGVEKNGTGILEALMNDGKGPEDENGWRKVRETVDRYLRSANLIIDECYEINGRDSLNSPYSAEVEATEQPRRKVDSGISISSGSQTSHRPSTSGSASIGSHASKRSSREKRVSDHSIPGDYAGPVAEAPSRPASSTLERIARELRKVRSRGDIRSVTKQDLGKQEPGLHEEEQAAMPLQKEKKARLKPSLRKMRSTSFLHDKDRRENEDSQGPAPTTENFDVDEMKRQRLLWEAKQRKEKMRKGSS